MLMMLLPILSVIRHLICSNNLNRLLNLNLIHQTLVDWGKKWLVDFNTGNTQLVSFDLSDNNVSTDVKMDGFVLEGKSSFKILVLTFSSKLDKGSYIIFIAKTASKKIGVLIHSLKFLSPEVALYLYKSAIQVFPIGITLVDVLKNWLNWFHLLFLEEGLLVILIDCMIFLWPFLNVTKMFMSTVSFLAQLDSELYCLLNAFLLPMILVALSLELTDIF